MTSKMKLSFQAKEVHCIIHILHLLQKERDPFFQCGMFYLKWASDSNLNV